MNFVALILGLAVAIALGIALAPHILPILGWGLAVVAGLSLTGLAVLFSIVIARMGIAAAVSLCAAVLSHTRLALLEHLEELRGAWSKALRPTLDDRSTGKKEWLDGLATLVSYALWALLLSAIAWFAFATSKG